MYAMQNLSRNLGISGFILLCLSIAAGWFVVPNVITDQVMNKVTLSNGTEVWDNWVNIPIPVYIEFYIFNVTNSDDVSKGEKPILQQVGPYVYREKRRKVDISINEDEDSVKYRQPIDYFFVKELSAGSEDDLFTVINVPLVVVTHLVDKTSGWLNSWVSPLISMFGEKLFIQKTVSELLFHGYHQAMMAYLEDMSGKKILHNRKFGFFYPKNGTDDGVYEMNMGIKNIKKLGEIKSWDNKTHLDYWPQSPLGVDYCNMLNGSDGSVFPPFLTKDRVLRIFSPDLCRSLYLTFNEEISYDGIPGYRFTAPKSLLEDPFINEDNLCFCPEYEKDPKECLKTGAISLSACREGAPVAITPPHFFEAAEEYLHQSVGLKPVKELHETFIDVEPNTGLVLRARKRFQINVELKKRPLFDDLMDVPDMLFPILWADEYVELDEVNVQKMKANLTTPLLLIDILTWTLVTLGAFLILAGLSLCIFQRKEKINIV